MEAQHRRVMLPLLCLLAAGCSSDKSLYTWGAYEKSVFTLTETPDAVDVQAEIARLSAVVEEAKQSDRSVPPGLHAHLGYLYARSGDYDTAAAAFLTEKELFPESTVFIDGLMERMQGPAGSGAQEPRS